MELNHGYSGINVSLLNPTGFKCVAQVLPGTSLSKEGENPTVYFMAYMSLSEFDLRKVHS